MYRNSLVARTGLNRGVVLNGVGQNITEHPAGAGNDQVGSWYLDFSGVFQSNPTDFFGFPAAAEWVGFDNAGGDIHTYERRNLVMVDNEYTIVLADARGLDDEAFEESETAMDLLDDEGDPEQEDGAFIQPGDREAVVKSISVKLHLMCPNHRMASVWRTSEINGDIDEPVDSTNPTELGGPDSTLGAWLDLNDATASGVPDADLIEGFGDVDEWTPHWELLRWTLHWALVVVDTVDSQDEGIVDWMEANNATGIQFPTQPRPVGGPTGFINKYGGSLAGMRLWQPGSGEGGGLRIVARGEQMYPYQLDGVNTLASPAMASDLDLVDDIDPTDADSAGFEHPSGATQRGRICTVNVRLNRNVRLHPGQMLIFVVQTGRARLVRELVEVEGQLGPAHQDLVIAGPELVDGRNGPLIPLLHYAARVVGSVK